MKSRNDMKSTALAGLSSPPEPWPELAPRSAGLKCGVEHTTALRADVARAWPFVVQALTAAGVSRAAQGQLAERLFEVAAVTKPSETVTRVEGRRAIVEEGLAKGLQRGLPLKLAAAEVGVNLERVRAWERADPDFAARLRGYARTGVARVHGMLLQRAENGSETAIVKALEYSGEPEYVQRVRVGRIGDEDVLASEPYRRLRAAVEGVLCEGCRERLAEALADHG